ncbi:GumC family protein [Silvibacterium acidisoli]|uniref:GumC family protein n=1 Tax=Acidobacteriaceae bacterium ZG23-2 TaxID=2883246 RepID=UPI00406C8DF0
MADYKERTGMQGANSPQESQQIAAGPVAGISGQSTFTPADFRKLLIKRKWIILGAVLLGVGLAVYYITSTIPQFEAVARLHIDLGRSTNIGIEDLIEQKLGGGEDVATQLQTQIQIMQSQSVLMAVADTLDLYHKKPFSDLFKVTPYNGHLTPVQLDRMTRMIGGATRILILPNTEIVEIHFQNQDPRLAKDVANAIVDAYLDRDLRSRYEGTTRVSNWLQQQLSSVKKQVEDAERNLTDFQRKNNMLALDDQGGNLIVDSLRTVNQQLAEAQADRIVKEARYKMALTRNPDLLVSVASGTVLSGLRAQQSALLVQAAQLKAKFGSGYPKVKELDSQLASVQHDIDSEINNLTKRFAEEYNASVKTQDLLQARLDSVKQEAYKANESAAQFDILKHSAEAASELYDGLQLKLKEAGVTAGLNSNNVDVIDQAQIPPFPILPKKRSALMYGLLGGLFAGIVIAFFVESLDDTVRTSDDAENISQLPTLAVIPHFAVANRKSSGSAALDKAEQQRLLKVSPDLVSYVEPQSIGAEGFRTFRSSILLSAVDHDPQLLLVTSSFAAEGKSTCAANLAISFAQRSARVLLVDTDLRRGTTHMKFRLSNRAGLSTLLSRESGNEVYEHPLPEYPNLAVLSRGPIAPNPGEILASRAMEDLLTQWRKDYDHIILDSSPILAVADTLSLAPHADATIILVRAGVTRKRALVKVREQLRRANARILGTVINDVDLRMENYYTYSKRYDYGYKSNYGAGYGVTDEDK